MSVKIPTLGLRCHGLSLGFLALSIVLVFCSALVARSAPLLASASWEKQPVKRIAACQQIRRNGMQHANSKMHLRSLAPKKICRQSICQQFPPACERLPKSIFGMCNNMQYAHGMCAGHVRRALLPLPSALSLPQLALRLNACPQREPQRERE
jgi:hypothetical protein